MPSPLPSRLRRLASPFFVVAAAAALMATARADTLGSVLHEYIPPDPGEDVSFAATTLEGDLPAAIQTPSGLATAPDPRRSPAADHVYGGATTDDGPDSTYEPDRDTRRPNVENYDDPFSPATAPFKRLRAYDWVDADYSLRVRDKALRTIAVGGAVGPGDEPFYGDMSVELIPGQPVRIPTVGPGSRILRMHANPEVQVDVLRDGADNWFVRGKERQRVRIVMELAIPRDTFGRAFADVDWSVLDALETSRAAAGAPGAHLHDAAFNEVAQAIGISRAMRPRDVVRKMVDYFRAFSPSEEPPTGRQDIYLDLALSKKGVCRHRAFGFLVTALGIGVPARMVVNEAHAWVEVFDAKLWHRIDLGGAAANLDNDPDPGRPAYMPPPDPYAWPNNRDSGQDLADRNRAQAGANGSNANGSNGAADGDAGAPGGQGPAAPGSASANGNSAPEPANGQRQSEVTVAAVDGEVRRGLPLHLSGTVASEGAPCAHLRVDVVMVPHLERRGSSASPSVQGVPIGSLSTDARGKYDGAVVVPRDLALGDYDLKVVTPGDARCGAGQTR
jgi:hypothetical protein